MKVHKLRDLMAGLCDSDEVYLASDPEGNNYLPLDGWSEGYYKDGFYFDLWDKPPGGGKDRVKKVVVLWP